LDDSMYSRYVVRPGSLAFEYTPANRGAKPAVLSLLRDGSLTTPRGIPRVTRRFRIYERLYGLERDAEEFELRSLFPSGTARHIRCQGLASAGRALGGRVASIRRAPRPRSASRRMHDLQEGFRR